MVYFPHAEYFEGILQLRGDYEHVLDWVIKTTAKEKKAVITKEKKVRGGLDLYYSSQRYLQALGKKIGKRFLGIMKVSVKLHTKSRITSKELYRVTVLFRALPFRLGDVIDLYDEQFQIINAGSIAVIKNVKSGKKIKVSLQELERAKLHE